MSDRPDRAAHPGGAEPRVLIIGETGPLAHLLDARLRHEGMSPTTCTSSTEALAALEARRYDAVVFDVALHDAARARLLKTLRGAVAANELPVVVLTPSSSPADPSGRELVIGARETLRVPFTGDELVRKLRASLVAGDRARSAPAAGRRPADG
jgi:DNA-binding response OmpR family regulator